MLSCPVLDEVAHTAQDQLLGARQVEALEPVAALEPVEALGAVALAVGD